MSSGIFGFDWLVLNAVRQRLHSCEVNVSFQTDLSILATADIRRIGADCLLADCTLRMSASTA